LISLERDCYENAFKKYRQSSFPIECDVYEFDEKTQNEIVIHCPSEIGSLFRDLSDKLQHFIIASSNLTFSLSEIQINSSKALYIRLDSHFQDLISTFLYIFKFYKPNFFTS
jgi:hypothetical protein